MLIVVLAVIGVIAALIAALTGVDIRRYFRMRRM